MKGEIYLRQINGKIAIVVTLWGALAIIFHLYTSSIGSLEPRIQRATHLLFLLPLAFILFPSKSSDKKNSPRIMDYFLAIASLIPSLYLIINANELDSRIVHVTEVTTGQSILGIIIVILIVEACRRAVSLSFSIVVIFFIFYIFISPYFSGLFQSREVSLDRFAEMMYLETDQGVYGSLTGISTNILFVFIVFAAFMLNSGVGKYFMDLSIFIAGRFRGGPAKIAAISSGLYGSISGSSVADTYATGSFTIPLMRKIGYPPIKAGAIEAVSSAGGPLLPPVMGAAAFVMAEMTGTSYTIVIKAAILSAVLYYIGVIASIHFEAVKLDVGAVPTDMHVNLKTVLIGLPYFIPYITMIYFLFSGYSPGLSAVYAIIATFIIWIILRGNRITLHSINHAINFAIRGATIIACALAGAGVIVASLSQTGASLALGNIILSYSFDSLVILLILTMIIVLILGAGIPITPAYIITATVVAYAFSDFEIPTLSIHMFIFYFAILADVTPPVGVASFSAASIAETPPMKTAINTPQFAFAGFIVPFIFIIRPELLMYDEFSIMQIITSFLISLICVIVTASIISGYMFKKLYWLKRVVLGVLVLFTIIDLAYLSWISLLFLLLFIVSEYSVNNNSKEVNSKSI